MRLVFIIILSLIFKGNVVGQQLKQFESLTGYWSFSVGDDYNWRLPSHDFSGWDRIYTGRSWESEGYQGYNGYAWYKRKVEIPFISSNEKIYLKISRIDDADEVYFNGTLIGKMGAFPPDVRTAYSEERLYAIPSKLINKNGLNIIAVRVYDVYYEGGILGGVGLYKDLASKYLMMDLSGDWKFKPGKNENFKLASYDDSDWDVLSVPGKWESQGYEYLNGYAWYRKTFNWKRSNDNRDVFVILGKIDDRDKTYLNGEEIGSTDQLKRSPYYLGNDDYKTLRAYRIPVSKLKSGTNVLAVQVWDDKYDGGMYSGPVGIMSVELFERYFTEYEKEKSFLEYIFDRIFE